MRLNKLNPSIASITTAYNAAKVLPRQIDALLAQSRPLQEIVVIDNGSRDGTRAMLAERYPQVTVLSLPQNVGAAGGWAAGLSYGAIEKHHDWVWNFDDDSVPGADALESLLTGAGSYATDPEVGMLVPVPIHRDTGKSFPPVLWRDGFVKPDVGRMRQPVWFADLAVASGCLVRREVVETIGIPRADFFMDIFDFEYCLRLRSRGYKIAVVRRCEFSHELGKSRTFRLGGLNYNWPEHAPWREYYISRNLTYLVRVLYPTRQARLAVARRLIRHGLLVLLFSEKKIACLGKMIQGWLDGRRGMLGVRFLP